MRKIIKLTESQFRNLVDETLNEQEQVNELDFESYNTSETFAPLREAIKKNKIVSVIFVKKDGTLRPMAIKRTLSSNVFSTREKSDAQRNLQQSYNFKRFIDVNAYIKKLKELGNSPNAKEIASNAAWRTIPLEDTLGFLAGGKFFDVREENNIMERYGEEIYNGLTRNMVRAVEAEQAQAEAGLGENGAAEDNNEQPINENKKTIKLVESNIPKIIKKILKEWYHDEYYEKPERKKGIGEFENIDWRVLFDTLVTNYYVASGKKSDEIGANYNDLTDYEGMLSFEELQHLEDFGLVEKMGAFPVIGDKYGNFDAFYNKAKEIWNKESPRSTNDDHYEEPYLRGREPES